ncbi:ATP synthase delta chain, chloroplastic [Diospyros lotus]|uniref:ATP synthase delta chain, chloroplastic n=1 Tax=Diospyros lotus TaxID=55363 RepID=UPI00224C8F17|nr:ATP synthase delta chain, chloroplastic [Diospyros lotus]
MAALQQSPITFQSRVPPATRATAKLQARKPLNLSFSGGFSSLKIPKFAVKKFRRGGARMADTASRSYASALADVAKSNGTLETTSADMEKVDEIFSEQVYEFFLNPTVDIEKKRKVIDEIATESSLQPHTANFLNILIDMKRIELVKEIVKEFEVVYNKLTDTELAVVSSVVKLESQHLAQIAKGVQRLTGAKNVRIKTVIDPSLVAGFTIRYGSSGSKLIDFSVKKQLEDITAQLDIGEIQLAA